MQVRRIGLLFLTTVLALSHLGCENPNKDDDLDADEGSFVFVQYDEDYSGNEDFIVLHGDIISLIDSVQVITVNRLTHSKPAEWSTSFCVGPACLPPFLDSFTFSLAPRDTALFSLDTYPNQVAGSGSWTMVAMDSTTMEADSVHITLSVINNP